MSLDIEQHDQLLAWLKASGLIAPEEQPRFENLTGGVSNRTVLVERSNGESWVLKQALAKLRVKVDWFSPPERVHREAAGLRWLERLAPPGTITPLLFEDFDEHLIAMRAVPRPHANWKTMLLSGDLQMEHVDQFANLLGTIHRRSNEQRAEVQPVFADTGFFESLRLEPYYAFTANQVPEAAPFIDQLLADCRVTKETIVHGDFSPKNVLVHKNRLVLLDHEVIHFGDPGFDLGFSTTHYLSKAHHLPEHRRKFQEAAVQHWQTYQRTAGNAPWTLELESRAIRHTLACMLGRVRGRSPLEYLGEVERERQASSVVALMADPPLTFRALAEQFVHLIEMRT